MRSLIDLKPEVQQFYKATAGQWGTDEAAVLAILKKVNTGHVQTQFNQAVQDEFKRHGKTAQGALDALDKDYSSESWFSVFNGSKFKRAMDVYYYGQDRYRSTGWEYRKEGFHKIPHDIVQTLARFPVLAGGSLLALLGVGFMYPTLASLGGAAVCLYAALGVIRHEIGAWRINPNESPHARSRWAEQLVGSGEDLSCIVLTLPGVKGIYSTLKSATKVAMVEYAATTGSTLAKLGEALQEWTTYETNLPWLKSFIMKPNPQILRASAHLHEHVSPGQKALVLVSLVDEILLPFAKWSGSSRALKE